MTASEVELAAPFGGGRYRLKGRIDRLQRREEKLLIADLKYKEKQKVSARVSLVDLVEEVDAFDDRFQLIIYAYLALHTGTAAPGQIEAAYLFLRPRVRGDYEGRLAEEDLAACDTTMDRIAGRLDELLGPGALRPWLPRRRLSVLPPQGALSQTGPLPDGRPAMVKSLFVTASAGSGKTYRLTREVRSHLEREGEFVVAATFTNAAAAEMEKRILETIEEGAESAAEKLRLIMRASRVHFSTIDALFHRFLSTEATVPQVADDHERALITAAADVRFFRDPRVLADIERIVIAARTLRLPPESLIEALDRSRETLAAWDCPADQLDELRAAQARIAAEYGRLQDRVRAVAEATKGALRTQVVAPLLEPIAEVDLGRALFLKSDLEEVRVAAADRKTPAYAALRELYPPMRRLVAEHLINTKRLRSALLKHFSALRAEVLGEEKERLGRLYFDDIPAKLMALDGPASPDRPHFMARLYELGFHRTAHLLLDEFQDTSRTQFDLLRPLAEEILGSVGADAEGERSLFLVGDWKQSIYQWREAAPDYLRESIAPYLASGQLAAETLPHNYRSTPLLIGFFNHLVAELFAGTGKVNLQTPPAKPKHPYGGISEVAVIPAACGAGDDPAYERLVEALREKKAACGCPWGDMAVLCRTNGHMDKVAAALARAGIPTSGIRGRELLSLREGTALWLSLVALFTEHDGRFIPRSPGGPRLWRDAGDRRRAAGRNRGQRAPAAPLRGLRRSPARAGVPLPARPDRDAVGRGGAVLREARRRRCRRLPGVRACDVAPHHRPRGGARRPGETGHDPQHEGP